MHERTENNVYWWHPLSKKGDTLILFLLVK